LAPRQKPENWHKVRREVEEAIDLPPKTVPVVVRVSGNMRNPAGSRVRQLSDGGLPSVQDPRSYGPPLAQQVQGYGPGFSEAATRIGSRKHEAEEDRGPAGLGPGCVEGTGGKRMVSPQAKRAGVGYLMTQRKYSQRRACELVRVARFPNQA
jgi:hypothetical protein